MTIEIEGLVELITAMEIAAWLGSIAFLLLAGIALYLLVRPPRRRAESKRTNEDEMDAEELRTLVDRMERRLAVLERVVDEHGRPPRKNGDERPPVKRIN